MFYYNERHSPEAQEWCYRMMNDPNQWEKFRFIDTINAYNNIIEDSQKEYEQACAATDHYTQARISNVLKHAKAYLAMTQREYESFKEFKAKTSISR
jgi:hypothetical protein